MFLESTLLFIARTIDCGMEQLPLLLDEIFMERSHPFYVNRCCELTQTSVVKRADLCNGSISRSPSEISEIGDADSGPEVFEDETRARRATFALRQPGGAPHESKEKSENLCGTQPAFYHERFSGHRGS